MLVSGYEYMGWPKLTVLTPTRSDRIPQKGQAKSASSSSAKPRFPTASPTPFREPIRSVITKDTDELRNTRNAIEKGQTPNKYVAICTLVAVNILEQRKEKRQIL
jgi:hypothetical protein